MKPQTTAEAKRPRNFTPPRKAVDRRGMAVQIIGELSHGQNFRSAVVVVGFHGCPSAPLCSVRQDSLPVAYYLYGAEGDVKVILINANDWRHRRIAPRDSEQRSDGANKTVTRYSGGEFQLIISGGN